MRRAKSAFSVQKRGNFCVGRSVVFSGIGIAHTSLDGSVRRSGWSTGTGDRRWELGGTERRGRLPRARGGRATRSGGLTVTIIGGTGIGWRGAWYAGGFWGGSCLARPTRLLAGPSVARLFRWQTGGVHGGDAAVMFFRWRADRRRIGRSAGGPRHHAGHSRRAPSIILKINFQESAAHEPIARERQPTPDRSARDRVVDRCKRHCASSRG